MVTIVSFIIVVYDVKMYVLIMSHNGMASVKYIKILKYVI